MPVKTESPFAPGRHYPPFIAHTGPCARPKSSPGFALRYSQRSLQVTVSPCWKLALPDIISVILAWLLRPLSRGVSPVLLPVSTWKTSASPQGEKARHARSLCNATSTEGNFRDCSHSFMFKPPCLLGLPVAPTLCSSTGQPDLLHHAYPGWLPAPGCGIATCLNRAIDMTGLSPVGSRPCRLLLTHFYPFSGLTIW
jgi:hypothetical protein